MQISRRGNVLLGGGEDGSCRNCPSLDCSWIVWQSPRSPVSPRCQFPRLLPLSAHRPVVQVWSGELFSDLPLCALVAFTGRVWRLGPSSAFFAKPPLRVQCSCFASKSPRLLPAGDICMGWINLMVRHKTISLGTLRGATPAPEPNQGRTTAGTRPADGELSGRTLILCKMWIFLFPRRILKPL